MQTVRPLSLLYLYALVFRQSQCNDNACKHTEYHTLAYIYSDAQNLFIRATARIANLTLHQEYLTPAGGILCLAPAVPALPKLGKISCANPDCFVKSTGARTTGNRKCVGRYCKACCVSAANTACRDGTLRQECCTHRIGGYEGPVHVAAGTQLAPPGHMVIQAAPAIR